MISFRSTHALSQDTFALRESCLSYLRLYHVTHTTITTWNFYLNLSAFEYNIDLEQFGWVVMLTPLVQIDVYRHHSFKCAGYGLTTDIIVITFFILICLQSKFSQMFFIPRHRNPENLMQIDSCCIH